MPLSLQIITPRRIVVDAPVDAVSAPGAAGSLGVLPGHEPLVTSLAAGELRYRSGAEEQVLYVAEGFMEVQPDRVVVLIADAARPEEIDVERARRQLEEARQQMDAKRADLDYERIRLAMLQTLAQLRVAEHRKKGR